MPSEAAAAKEPGRSWSSALILEDSALETCCVCLDSLSEAPVALLLAGAAREAPRRACRHLVHSRCAELLHPQKCPLCRAPFTALSEPLDRCRLGALRPCDIAAAVRRLCAQSAGGGVAAPAASPTPALALAPTRAVVELLVAVWPVPEASLWEAIERLGLEEQDGEISEDGLEQLMCHFGMQCSEAKTTGPEGGSTELRRASYPLATRALRRLNWALLKAAGAVGASLFCGGCGLALGVAIGGVLAIPRKRIPCLDGDGLVLAIKTAWLLCLAVYHGAQRADLVCQGLRYGTGFGLIFGCFHGLVHVNPERHGLQGVFMTGLTGQATLGALFGSHLPLSAANLRSAPRVDVFGPSSK